MIDGLCGKFVEIFGIWKANTYSMPFVCRFLHNCRLFGSNTLLEQKKKAIDVPRKINCFNWIIRRTNFCFTLKISLPIVLTQKRIMFKYIFLKSTYKVVLRRILDHIFVLTNKQHTSKKRMCVLYAFHDNLSHFTQVYFKMFLIYLWLQILLNLNVNTKRNSLLLGIM